MVVSYFYDDNYIDALNAMIRVACIIINYCNLLLIGLSFMKEGSGRCLREHSGVAHLSGVFNTSCLRPREEYILLAV